MQPEKSIPWDLRRSAPDTLKRLPVQGIDLDKPGKGINFTRTSAQCKSNWELYHLLDQRPPRAYLLFQNSSATCKASLHGFRLSY